MVTLPAMPAVLTQEVSGGAQSYAVCPQYFQLAGYVGLHPSHNLEKSMQAAI